MNDDEIRLLVTRLARTHPSGGRVIECAAILAEGAGSHDVMTWIVAHGGEPEATTAKASTRHGLHGSLHDTSGTDAPPPSRFVLPAGALD